MRTRDRCARCTLHARARARARLSFITPIMSARAATATTLTATTATTLHASMQRSHVVVVVVVARSAAGQISHQMHAGYAYATGVHMYSSQKNNIVVHNYVALAFFNHAKKMFECSLQTHLVVTKKISLLLV